MMAFYISMSSVAFGLIESLPRLAFIENGVINLSFGEVLPNKAADVLIGASLQWAMWITKVNE
tara:strand:+ start:3303 stop:3491 length:189 start_codon:yes stop_codon:yes gene_type:complete